MSSSQGSSPSEGIPTAMGLVPNSLSFPRVGTAHRMVLVKAVPMSPSSTAISAHRPAMPKWLEFRTEA